MKYAIPLGAILLVGIALGIHRGQAAPTLLARPVPIRDILRQEVPALGGPVGEPGGMAPAIASPDPFRKKPTGSEVSLKPSAAAGWKKMLGTMDRNMGLTPNQAAFLEALLRERDEEVRIYHESIRTTGVIDIRDYDWRMGLMKETWFRRMDALLDGAQHEKFLALLAKGFLSEGLEFNVEPGMTVLD